MPNRITLITSEVFPTNTKITDCPIDNGVLRNVGLTAITNKARILDINTDYEFGSMERPGVIGPLSCNHCIHKCDNAYSYVSAPIIHELIRHGFKNAIE